MRVVLLVIALCMLVNESSAAFYVQYSCSATNVLTFDAWGDTAVATVHAENRGAFCGTAATGNTVFIRNGGVVSSKTHGTVDPTTKDATNCDYTGSPSRSITLILSTTLTVTTSSGRTTITCTIGQPHTAVKSVSVGSVSGSPFGSIIQIIPGAPSLKVISATVTSGSNIVTTPSMVTAALGDDIKIVSVIDTSGTANTVLLTACKARSAAGAIPVVSLTLPTGCTDTSGGVFKTDIAPTDDRTVPIKHISISPVFKAFKTANAPTLFIECTVKVCIVSDKSCDIPTCPPPPGRRRRSVETRPLGNGTLSAAVFLVTSGRTHDLSNGIHSDRAPTVSSCLSHVSFISVVAILAVLLVVSLAVSVFFCSKLIRQNNSSQQKEAYPNPAYKA